MLCSKEEFMEKYHELCDFASLRVFENRRVAFEALEILCHIRSSWYAFCFDKAVPQHIMFFFDAKIVRSVSEYLPKPPIGEETSA